MDPWDAHFRSAVPVLNDPRVQDLGLAHALMLLKGVVTREYATPAFADSRSDYQHAQGWSGWFYSFEQLPKNGADRENWAPSLAADKLAMLPIDETGFVMDLHHLRLPFIDDAAQSGHVSLRGERIAAIRSFRSPKSMHVAVDFDYRSDHACGDGTRLTLVRTGGPGEPPETLASFMTMDEEYGEFGGAVTLRPGNTLHIVSDPLDDDACDRVEVHLKMTPIEVENSSWSALSRRAALAQHEERRAIEADKPTPGSDEIWTTVPDNRPDEDSLFNIALIFDRNRYPHAMSVIRSIRHFTTSRTLVFHLVVTRDVREELEEYFAGTNMTLHLYDHNLCAFVAKTVLPFSNPEIHVSAHCKMFLSEIVKDAERILYLDTDVTVLSDLSACYNRPSANPAALLSMSVDMGDACQRSPNACWPIGMHWRIPPGLECGNVPFRHARERVAPQSCAEEGELETLQVNGGVILFELARMKDAGFLERYVQSIVHHFRIMDNRLARWGEQDFINSFFRLFPEDLELLPCGCNYQWFGARREVKCGAQPVHIAHHWCVRVTVCLAYMLTRNSAGPTALPRERKTRTTRYSTTSPIIAPTLPYRPSLTFRHRRPVRQTRQRSTSSTRGIVRDRITTARQPSRSANSANQYSPSRGSCRPPSRPTSPTPLKHKLTRSCHTSSRFQRESIYPLLPLYATKLRSRVTPPSDMRPFAKSAERWHAPIAHARRRLKEPPTANGTLTACARSQTKRRPLSST